MAVRPPTDGDGYRDRPDDSMADDAMADDVRRRRLRFRCWHRGTKELDLLMGSFVDRHLDELEPRQLDQLERLLNTPDLDLYNWIVSRDPPPTEERNEVLGLIIDFHHRK